MEQTPDQSSSNTTNKYPVKSKEPSVSNKQLVAEDGTSMTPAVADTSTVPQRSSQSSKNTLSAKKSTKRKMQVSNGHYLDFDHLARLTNAISSLKKFPKVKMSDLAEETGLPFRQVRNRVSIARALGLLEKNILQLTSLGNLISIHDPFCESIATLEYLHYKAASNFENLIWYEIFNSLLIHENMMKYTGWMEYFQKSLSNQYTEKSLKDHLGKEVRFVLDAYTKQNFQKLLLLHQDEADNIFRRRYTKFVPLVLSAMIYNFCATRETHLSQVGKMAVTPGSPAVVFGLDATLFRQQIEGLHDRGWVRYETTHNLDQIRLKPDFSALEFLTAHFEEREPREDIKQSPGDII